MLGIYMYFVTTVQVDKNGKMKFSRCVGFFECYEEAKDVVINNKSDIFEGNYHYVVIEKIMPGLYPDGDDNPHWFKISDDHNCQ